MNENHDGYLRGVDGEKSSKRLWGSILIPIGAGLLVSVGIAALFIDIADPDTALRAGTTIIGSGLVLFGAGAAERFGIKRNGVVK